MPMTQDTAQTLLKDYQVELNRVAGKLKETDKTKSSPVLPFIPKLLKALNAIADSRAISIEYSFETAQTDLAASVKEKKPSRSGSIPETTLEYLARQYHAQTLFELQKQIREGLKAAPIAKVPPTVEESVASETVSLYDSTEGLNTIAAEKVRYPLDNELVNTQEDDAPQAEQFVEGLDLSFWLKVGSLSVALVASIALSIAAVMTANPVLLGVGIVATAVSGVALARTLGFFNSNPVTHEVPETSEKIQDKGSAVSMASE